MSIDYENAMRVMAEIFSDLGDELDIEDIDLAPDRRLTDFGMESISLVYLISELQQHFGLGDRVFRDLREAGRPLKDMTVDDLARAVVRAGARDCA